MKKFSEFGIKPSVPSFTGDKIKINKLLNREITIHDFKIEDSKYGKGNEKCLHLQISISNTKYVVFTGSIYLIETIQKVPKGEFPFTTTIVKENERFEFT